MPEATHVVLSVRPRHAANIIAGNKTVELRRRRPTCVRQGSLVLIYSCQPDQAIIGVARVRDVQRMLVKRLWTRVREHACVSKAEFDGYFANVAEGYAFFLEDVIEATPTIKIDELRERFGFLPPQSFRYVDDALLALFEDERLQTSNRHQRRLGPRGQSTA
jgi:predicted transcriptional regulator